MTTGTQDLEEEEEGYVYGISDDDDDDNHDRGRQNADGGIDLEAWWPRGIIKTVEVEVVEEVNEEYVAAVAARGERAGSGSIIVPMTGRVTVPPAAAAFARQPNPTPRRAVGRDAAGHVMGRGSGASGAEQDWEALLRAGPPR
jgi:hypothetical protein